MNRDKILAAIRASARARSGSVFGAPFGVHSRGVPSLRWCENLDGHFRVTKAESHIRNAHDWYTADAMIGETTHGIVCQLPARDGSPRYCAGYSDPYNDNAGVVDLRDVHDSPEQAARDAEHMAERYAEECRDAYAKDQAEQQQEQLRDDIAMLRAEHSALAREIRAASRAQFRLFEPGDVPPAGITAREPSAICKALRAQLQGYQRDVKRAVKRIRALSDNYWLAVEY